METTWQKTALEKHRVYRMNILKVSNERKKSFVPKGASSRMFVWDIFMEDPNGKYQVEYLSPTPDQTVFAEGNMAMEIKCMGGNEFSNEIVPMIPGDNPQISTDQLSTVSKNSLITGTTYAFAMTCAKDIMVAKLQSNPGIDWTSLESDQLFNLANDIDIWLTTKRDS